MAVQHEPWTDIPLGPALEWDMLLKNGEVETVRLRSEAEERALALSAEDKDAQVANMKVRLAADTALDPQPLPRASNQQLPVAR